MSLPAAAAFADPATYVRPERHGWVTVVLADGSTATFDDVVELHPWGVVAKRTGGAFPELFFPVGAVRTVYRQGP